jgi:hypothetical protein
VIGTTGQQGKARAEVRIEARQGGPIRVIVERYEQIECQDIQVVYEGDQTIQAGRIYLKVVTTFKSEGFRGLKPIQSGHAFDAAQSIAHVVLTGQLLVREDAEQAGTDLAALSQAAVEALTVDGLRGRGFGGFVTFDDLRQGGLSDVPQGAGVYVVVRESPNEPMFLEQSIGGHFKKNNPTELVSVLQRKWVAAPIIYIGKGDVLRRRLKQYADFGSGKPVGHWGGRYIWQLADSNELRVAWKSCTEDETAAGLEAKLVGDFKLAYRRLPFANIVDPSRSA